MRTFYVVLHKEGCLPGVADVLARDVHEARSVFDGDKRLKGWTFVMALPGEEKEVAGPSASFLDAGKRRPLKPINCRVGGSEEITVAVSASTTWSDLMDDLLGAAEVEHEPQLGWAIERALPEDGSDILDTLNGEYVLRHDAITVPDRFHLLQKDDGDYIIIDWENRDLDESGYSYREALAEVGEAEYYFSMEIVRGDQPHIVQLRNI